MIKNPTQYPFKEDTITENTIVLVYIRINQYSISSANDIEFKDGYLIFKNTKIRFNNIEYSIEYIGEVTARERSPIYQKDIIISVDDEMSLKK